MTSSKACRLRPPWPQSGLRKHPDRETLGVHFLLAEGCHWPSVSRSSTNGLLTILSPSQDVLYTVAHQLHANLRGIAQPTISLRPFDGLGKTFELATGLCFFAQMLQLFIAPIREAQCMDNRGLAGTAPTNQSVIVSVGSSLVMVPTPINRADSTSMPVIKCMGFRTDRTPPRRRSAESKFRCHPEVRDVALLVWGLPS